MAANRVATANENKGYAVVAADKARGKKVERNDSWLTSITQFRLTDWLYRAATGELSPRDRERYGNEAAGKVARAGGTVMQQQQAKDEVERFIDSARKDRDAVSAFTLPEFKGLIPDLDEPVGGGLKMKHLLIAAAVVVGGVIVLNATKGR